MAKMPVLPMIMQVISEKLHYVLHRADAKVKWDDIYVNVLVKLKAPSQDFWNWGLWTYTQGFKLFCFNIYFNDNFKI